MSARQNIRSAHSELKKTLEDGRNLKGAKERNECLTPGDPQFCHVLSTAHGKHLLMLNLDITECDGVVCQKFFFISALLVLIVKLKPTEFSRTSAS